ncbi:MAG: VOC family protein [Candidatus Buchananbacteria bacterium]|nr:VOC family protein [Candidatus Buchananbacteria bacterium]
MYRVSDLKKSEDFYIQVLGLKKAWEDLDAQMIGFVFEQSDSEIVIHTNSDIPKGDYSYLVEDVVKFCDAVKQLGHPVLLEPIDVRPGKYALIADPDGNEIPIIDLSKFGGKPKFD